ncbi:MAG: hypothetical protein H5U19_13075 [Rhodobacteraceae bacterium]|jgi:hypothetical protein|nr:hypothetical protein [Paracoccaceae bacterium]
MSVNRPANQTTARRPAVLWGGVRLSAIQRDRNVYLLPIGRKIAQIGIAHEADKARDAQKKKQF